MPELHLRRAKSEPDVAEAFDLVMRLAALDVEICAPHGISAETIHGTYYDPSAAHLAMKYAGPRSALFLAGPPGAAFATAGYTGEGGIAQLRNVFLVPERRGAGLGRRLVEAVLQAMRDDGYRQVRMVTMTPLVAAVDLYRSLGFAECPPFGPPSPPGGEVLDIYLARTL